MKHKGHVNVVIVGSGAGGGVVAKELCEAGLSVVQLERGEWVHLTEFHDDEFLHVHPDQMGPDERHVRVVRRGDQWVSAKPDRWGTGQNAACVGGGTTFYGGMAWRFMPEDFKMRSTYGAVEGSTLEDWPISYDDLEPYYEKVEYEIGVAGRAGDTPFEPPRKKPFPMPPMPMDKGGRLIAEAGKRLGLHPFHVPYLKNTIPYGGRPACQVREKCWGFACPYDARNGTHNTVIPMAQATGNFEIRTGCMAAEVIIDDSGVARGIRYFDREGKACEQSADLVVVSAGAMESARLLMNSKSRLFPHGAGNNHDLVGRNLQGHRYSVVNGYFDKDYYGPGPGRIVAFTDFLHHNEGMIGGGLIDAPQNTQSPFRFASGVPGWGKEYKDRLRLTFKTRVNIVICLQEMPVHDSRVTLDPDVKDAWGIPVLRLQAKGHYNDYLVEKFLKEQAKRLLQEAGAESIQANKSVPPGEIRLPHGQHAAGTCRMGEDPGSSVCNKYGQVHEIDNLFVADGSLHVTNSGLNPAQTIMALGYWVSDYIKREWDAIKPVSSMQKEAP